MSHSQTIADLFAAAKAFLLAAGLAEEDISWPNVKFQPKGKNLWASVALIPATVNVATLGSAGRDRETGLLQITVRVPIDTGDKVLRDIMDLARTTWRAGYSVGNCITRPPLPAQISVVDNWTILPITLRYRVDYNR